MSYWQTVTNVTYYGNTRTVHFADGRWLTTCDYPKAGIHFAHKMVPAHARYYAVVGFVTEDLGDQWRIAVHGYMSGAEAFLGVALRRTYGGR